jgi:asparagine synthase (glutamine-hydrolysing)
MCRIFGNLGASALTPCELDFLSTRQLSGGPDRQSHVAGAGWALGANRLAIQGIAGGEQPFRHGDGVVAVFNGEIYNHNDLRDRLRLRGHRFDDTCDGSLIPALYLEFGERFVEMLDGMFALAVLDLRTEGAPRLLLANDPAGVKSLYYWADAEDFVFSSELPALVGLSRVRTEPLPEQVDLYLSMLAVLGERTIFRGVRCLEPSTLLVAEPGRAPRVRAYRSAVTGPEPAADLDKAGEQLRELLDAEVAAMLTADVPVALITSGGLDSSLLTALAARHVPGVHTFNIAYRGDWPDDERHFAEQVAAACGATYHQVVADPADFPALIPRMVAHLGQPNAAPHCLSTYVLFQEVHRAGFKAAIAGEGADEMFGGYQRFADAMAGGPGWQGRYLDRMAAVPLAMRERLYRDDFRAELEAGGCRSREIRRLMAGWGERPGLARLLGFDQRDRFPYYILRRADHLSMASSVEVRVPFCAPRVTSFANALHDDLRIHDGKVKRAVYAAGSGLVPRPVLDRRKQPFTLPVPAMLRAGQPLFGYAQERLADAPLLYGMLERRAVRGLLDEQRERPDAAAAKALWALLVLAEWLDQLTGLLKPG